MNKKIERMEEDLQREYEKEYQRLLEEDWKHWKKTGKRRYDTEPPIEEWKYKGDTY